MERTIRTAGTPLDASLRSVAEARFGYDFGQVRIHTDEPAAQSAADVGSLAYTVGRHVVFGTNMYQPSSASGRTLIHHELVHVAQQSAADGTPTSIVPSDDASEREADLLAADDGSYRRLDTSGFSGGTALSRQTAGATVPAAPPSAWDALDPSVQDDLRERLSLADAYSPGAPRARFDGFTQRERTFILAYYSRLDAEGLWDDVQYIVGISGDAILLLAHRLALSWKMDAKGYCEDTWLGSRFHPNALWSYREMASEAGMHLTLEPDGLVHVHFDIWPPDTWGFCHLPLDARHLADMFGRTCAGDPECVVEHLCNRGITVPGHTCPPPESRVRPPWPPPGMRLPPAGVPWW